LRKNFDLFAFGRERERERGGEGERKGERARESERERATLHMNSFKYNNWSQTWTQTVISSEFTYNGFVKKDGNIYAIGVPLREKKKRRGPSFLFLLDINKLTLNEEVIITSLICFINVL
jgi:hypothetical protein